MGACTSKPKELEDSANAPVPALEHETVAGKEVTVVDEEIKKDEEVVAVADDDTTATGQPLDHLKENEEKGSPENNKKVPDPVKAESSETEKASEETKKETDEPVNSPAKSVAVAEKTPKVSKDERGNSPAEPSIDVPTDAGVSSEEKKTEENPAETPEVEKSEKEADGTTLPDEKVEKEPVTEAPKAGKTVEGEAAMLDTKKFKPEEKPSLDAQKSNTEEEKPEKQTGRWGLLKAFKINR